MQPGPEDLGILYTMITIFFIVTAFTLGFSAYALKADKHHDEVEPQGH
jgi:O-antigen/teichoic acid export membrane protein